MSNSLGILEISTLILTIAKTLVDHPADVTLTVNEAVQTTIFSLKVAPSDLGKIIGRQGQTATAIRTLLIGASGKYKMRAILEVLE